MLSQKAKSKWEVIDIHYPMKRYLTEHRKVDSTFGLEGFALAKDGVHPEETGHWIIAREVLLYLGFKGIEKSPGILESIKQVSKGEELLKLVTQRQNMMRDAWLTDTKHLRPGLPVGPPLTEAQTKANELTKQIDAIR